MKIAFLTISFALLFCSLLAKPNLKWDVSISNIYSNDTTGNGAYVYPIFKLGFGQSRIPVSELFLSEPKIEMSDYSNVRFAIKKFVLTLLFSDGTYETITNEGSKFTSATLEMLKRAKVGNRVVADGIEAYDIEGKIVTIPSRSIYLR